MIKMNKDKIEEVYERLDHALSQTEEGRSLTSRLGSASLEFVHVSVTQSQEEGYYKNLSRTYNEVGAYLAEIAPTIEIPENGDFAKRLAKHIVKHRFETRKR